MPRAQTLPVVQFVSKPIVEPFRDGSKCLVRDLCLHAAGMERHVLGTETIADSLRGHVTSHPIYRSGGNFSPAFAQNVRVAVFLLLKSRADLWHFVFAPNPRSSQVGKILRAMRRIPTIQTVASPPRDFARPSRLIFGDHVVTQSHSTRDELIAAFDAEGIEPPPTSVIFPPAPHIDQPSIDAQRAARQAVGCGPEEPLFLYPGDLEVSRGAELSLLLSEKLRSECPEARFVLAYRDKTPHARVRAEDLASRADPKIVRIVRNVPDMHALIAASTAVIFPVDDLYGKVDLPIVLLEAFRLRTPVVALDEGPLQSLAGAELIGQDWDRWTDVLVRLTREPQFRQELGMGGFQAIAEHYDPQLVASRYEAIYRELLGRG